MKKPYHDAKLCPARIGAHILQLRIDRGLSLKAVADLGGPSVETLQRVELGIAEVNLEMLEKLGTVFNVRPMELLAGGNAEIEHITQLVCRLPPKELAALRKRLERKVLN